MVLDITNKPDETKVVNTPSFAPPSGATDGKPLASPKPADASVSPPPLEVEEYFEQKKLSTSGILAVVSLVIFLLLVFALYAQSLALNSQTKTDIKKNDDIVNQLNAKDVAQIKAQTENFTIKANQLDKVQAKNPLYEDLIKDIAATVVKNGKINNLAIDEKGNVKIDLVLADIVAIRKQLEAFQANKDFKNVQMTSVSIGGGDKPENTMTISFVVSPAAYRAANAKNNGVTTTTTVPAGTETTTTVAPAQGGTL